jgi:type IV pilus assembly protein PilB
MNFDEAVAYLSTTRSTLYKWLQAGKVPGHKLGRQWRFVESELNAYRSGASKTQKVQESLRKLSSFFDGRAEQRAKKRENPMNNSVSETNACDVAEQMIWDATSEGAAGIHLQPKNNAYEITYRGTQNLEKVISIDKETFNEINNYLQEVSSPIKEENKRRFFLGRKLGEGKVDLHIRYQQIETVTGKRVTLKITRSDHPANSLKAIAHGEDLENYENWIQSGHGIIAVTGSTGSGKTTTLHCMIHDLLKQSRVVFTMEYPVDFIIEGANQVEVDMNDPLAIENTFNAIYDSDLDVLCLGLSDRRHENKVFKLAQQAASSGHLVLLQMHEPTTETALKKLEEALGNDVRDIMIGVSAQRLEKSETGKGRIARYQLEAGKLGQSLKTRSKNS